MDQYVNQVSIRHLRYFVAIVRNGSFRRAAEELSISQPPLTRQIQQLEEILGAPLLERGPSGVKPTEAGQSFFTEAQNIMGLIERACSNVSLIGAGQLGQLDVGVFGSAVLDFVPRVVLHFRNRFPNVEVVLHNMDRETQIKALKERRIQIGFNRFFLNYPDLIWERVLHEKLLVAIPSDHPLTNKKVVSLRDLASEPLIFYTCTAAHQAAMALMRVVDSLMQDLERWGVRIERQSNIAGQHRGDRSCWGISADRRAGQCAPLAALNVTGRYEAKPLGRGGRRRRSVSGSGKGIPQFKQSIAGSCQLNPADKICFMDRTQLPARYVMSPR